jgi:predicted ATPase/class 3 adenylate cyclase
VEDGGACARPIGWPVRPKLFAVKELPTGVLTFLFTDVVGSTPMWERNPAEMTGAMALHDEILTREIEGAGGVVVRLKGEGDSFFAVFTRATSAVAAARAVQLSLAKAAWPPETPIAVRMAMHTGEAELRDGDYYGSAPNRCARLRAIAHGGQVLISGATAALVRDALPPDVALIDLGEHRLRDMNRTEHVYQLGHPELRRDFPPLKSLDLQASNLPLHLTSFVGRERELEEVRSCLSRERLVTLTGAGGSGKSRIAQQAAGELRERFPDGVWWVDLALLTDPVQVPDAVAATLGVREQPGRPILETLSAELSAKVTLILLDNCEHLVAAAADLASQLLRSAPSVRLLVASREALGISGERVVPVLELSDDDALQLFSERAQLGNSRFQLTDQNRQVATQICRRLDGIPLAIELAAARIKLMSVEQLYQRLDQRFAVLGGGGRGTQARQQTLRATADWSYDLLEVAEKTAFDMLAVCVGGFSLEAADAMCSPEMDALAAVSRLVDKSMIVAGETADGEPRYRILETLREYGLERLRGTEQEPLARARHLEYYLGLAERTNAAGDTSRMAAALDVELGNFLVAMEEAETAPPDKGLRLAVALAPCWPMHGHVGMGRAWSERMLARSGPHQPRLGWAHHELGWLAMFEGDLQTARSHLERSALLAGDEGDLKTAGRAFNSLAAIDMLEQKFESSRSRSEQGLRDLAEAGDVPGQAYAHHHLGLVAFVTGDYPLSHEHFERALELRKQGRDLNELSFALANVGRSAVALGRYEEARANLLQGFQLQLSIVDQRVLNSMLYSAASLAADTAEPRLALVLIGACQSMGVKLMAWIEGTNWLSPAARDRLGLEESEAALAEGARLTPLEAIHKTIDWLTTTGGKTPKGAPAGQP